MNIDTQIFSYQYAVTKPGNMDAKFHKISKIGCQKAPIIRLFCRGVDQDDCISSVLLHVHGYYPYFFVQVTDSLMLRISEPVQFIKDFVSNIEIQLIQKYPNIIGQITAAIHDVVFVKAIPFTGYQTSQQLFMKISVTEPNVLPLVANILRQGLVYSSFLVFETHIQLFMKFVQDCQISLATGLQVTNCQRRQSFQMSTCDYEFDCMVSDITPSSSSQILQQNAIYKQKISQLSNKSSPQLLGQLQKLQEQRIKMIRNLQFSQANDEVQIDDVNSDHENSEPPLVQQKMAKNDENLENLELDVKAFDEELDGGGDSESNQNSENESDSVQEQINEENTIKTDFQELHYSDEKDVPQTPFNWAGKTFDFRNEQTQEAKQFQIQENSDVIELSSDQEVEQKKQTKSIFPKYYCHQLDTASLNKLNNHLKNREIKPVVTQQIQMSQFQSQFDEFYKIYDQLQKSTQISLDQYLKYVYVEYSLISDAVVLAYTDKIAEQTIKQGIQDVRRHTTLEIYGFSENYQSQETFTKLITQYMKDVGIKCKYTIYFDQKQKILTEHIKNSILNADPDIIFSWKHDNNGFGRLVYDCLLYNFDLIGQCSRTPNKQSEQFSKLMKIYKSGSKAQQFCIKTGMNAIGLQMPGRLVFGVQKVSKMNLKLSDYKQQDVLKKLDHDKVVPELDDQIINQILNDNYINRKSYIDDGFFQINDIQFPIHTCFCSSIQSVLNCALIIQKLNFITAAQETSKLFKIPFYESITRGSQYKVEAFLFTEAREQQFVLGPSPTKYEVAKMKAMEATPLVAEPKSGFYAYPMLVFDFASLYPSIICAYNLCYNTILENYKNQQDIGPFKIQFRTQDFKNLSENDFIFSPAKCMFVKSRVREGILPKLMKQCLAVRKQIVKDENAFFVQKEQLQQLYQQLESMKVAQIVKEQIDTVFEEVCTRMHKCHARQMALKGLMNTTYGYTSASFTGRMPCASIADSIMDMSRQSLDACIQIVEKQFGCNVVYADTDSMFVDTKQLFCDKQYSKIELLQSANNLGKQILQYINSAIPPPMRLKLERIYMPALLVTKKRYVGQSFNPDTIDKLNKNVFDKIPRYIDAKGIESIRRDVPELTRQCVQNGLKVLFRNNDLSELKQYFIDYFTKYSVQQLKFTDFFFQRRCKIKASSSDRSLTANIASKQLGLNSFALQPEYGERVNYVIIKSGQVKLINQIQVPESLFRIDGSGYNLFTLHYSYYIEKQVVNPCQRLFALSGFSVEDTFKEAAQFLLRYQSVICTLPEFDQVKFRQLIPYFSKLNFKLTNFNIHKQINSISKYRSAPKILPSSYYQTELDNTIISKRVQLCVICQKLQTFTLDRVSICQGCIKIVKKQYYREFIQQQLQNEIQDSQIQIQKLQNICQQCFGHNQCGNYKCGVYIKIKELTKIIIINQCRFSVIE
ncbi:DNA_polymerase [Hexamita inflata]|uniref:DNA polymerase n=1 Tax=Hexamita inflata TaxID=28002 RepID=A0AA86Q8K2_9EUKA|nr:DNA polymerase [Hexamita inflata]